jgi:hypothetical protein
MDVAHTGLRLKRTGGFALRVSQLFLTGIDASREFIGQPKHLKSSLISMQGRLTRSWR